MGQEKISRAATVLEYKDSEIAAINALKDATRPMSLAELGVAAGTIVSIQTKFKKVQAGVLAVPAGMTAAEVVSADEEFEKPARKSVNQYSFVKDFTPKDEKDQLSDAAKEVLAFLKDSTKPLLLNEIPNAKPGYMTSLIRRELIAAEKVEVDYMVKSTHKVYTLVK